MKLRAERKYGDLRRLVVPQRVNEVEETLTAIDDFLDANEQLCGWIREHVGIGLSQTIDQSDWADNLGLFSRHVALLDEAVDPVRKDQASVSFTVDGGLPAQSARLRRIDGAWRYDPEGGYSENLPAAFHELARGLDRVRDDLESGRPSAAALRDNPDVLVEKVKDRLRRGVSLLSKARAAAEPASESQP